jgi:hypothetical protein
LFPSSCKVRIPDRHHISWRNVNFQQHYKVCINKKSLQFLWHSMHREDYRNIKVWGGRFLLPHYMTWWAGAWPFLSIDTTLPSKTSLLPIILL